MKKNIVAIVLLFFIFSWDVAAQNVRERFLGLDKLIGKGSFFDNHFTGFMLYDLDSQTVQYEKNSHMNFIPASTTKLLTFYASILVLRDSTTLLRYLPRGKDVVVWGTGDPTWNYPSLPQPGITAFFDQYENVYFSDTNWKDEAFGYGWQWDDYGYAYSAEKSPFPIYGNLIITENRNNRPFLKPDIYPLSIRDNPIRNVTRDFHSNDFYYNPRTYNGMGTKVPFITSQKTFIQLASKELNKNILVSKEQLPPDHFLLKGIKTESLYKEMLQESDNFIAEQLLLQISDAIFQELNTLKTIEYIMKTYLFDLPDVPQWVDGSGLSRHNLVTPRTMVTLAQKIYAILPDEMLFGLLPKGGVNGTLKNNYKASVPYIFAKTGTISNNHSLVGYIKTRNNKVYAFAFMNNNYACKASEVRREMEKVLLYIRDNF